MIPLCPNSALSVQKQQEKQQRLERLKDVRQQV